ncbi:MAG: NTP transferase domain-containing protein [Bacteroidales bacterium]|nr:NTP transferase domain-containing protein [Bacteroidales bacterium]
MKFAIIAAGEGSRLSAEGVPQPKPLVPLCGEPMIARLVRIFRSLGAEEVVVIVNRLVPETEAYIRQMQADTGKDEAPIRLIVETTPSSMHSFYALSQHLRGAKFCLTTVDTIFRENDFATYIHAFENSTADGLMAVTDHIDDEKPLYVATNDDLRITNFLDEHTPSVRYISGGIYCLTDKAIEVLHRCMAEGQSRMRNFQRALITAGLHIDAYPFDSKILDVDHAEDIVKAETFLSQTS